MYILRGKLLTKTNESFLRLRRTIDVLLRTAKSRICLIRASENTPYSILSRLNRAFGREQATQRTFLTPNGAKLEFFINAASRSTGENGNSESKNPRRSTFSLTLFLHPPRNKYIKNILAYSVLKECAQSSIPSHRYFPFSPRKIRFI